MAGHEYKIVPAPERARKVKGAKSPEARFAATLEEAMNALGAEGWEFVRTETFTVEERSGLTGKKSIDRQVMIYRRAREDADDIRAEAAAIDPVETIYPATATPAAEDRGPRILGRPVPPVTRFPREAEGRSDPE